MISGFGVSCDPHPWQCRLLCIRRERGTWFVSWNLAWFCGSLQLTECSGSDHMLLRAAHFQLAWCPVTAIRSGLGQDAGGRATRWSRAETVLEEQAPANACQDTDCLSDPREISHLTCLWTKEAFPYRLPWASCGWLLCRIIVAMDNWKKIYIADTGIIIKLL